MEENCRVKVAMSRPIGFHRRCVTCVHMKFQDASIRWCQPRRYLICQGVSSWLSRVDVVESNWAYRWRPTKSKSWGRPSLRHILNHQGPHRNERFILAIRRQVYGSTWTKPFIKDSFDEHAITGETEECLCKDHCSNLLHSGDHRQGKVFAGPLWARKSKLMHWP